MYIPCILLTDIFCLSEFQIMETKLVKILHAPYPSSQNPKIKIYNLTIRSLLIKSQLIISAICGGNSQHTKAGDSSEFDYLTVLYCTPPKK